MDGSRFLVPQESSGDSAASRIHSGGLFRQINIGKAAEPKPADNSEKASGEEVMDADTTKIEPSITIKDDAIDPQFETDLAVFDKALAVYNRSKDPDMNHEVVVRLCDLFTKLIQNAEAASSLPGPVRVKFEATTNKYLLLAEKYKQKTDLRLELIMHKAKSKQGESELNDLADILEHFYAVEEMLRAKAAHLGLSHETVVRLQNNIDLDRRLAERVIHIATKKDYTLNDLDDPLKMAERESSEYTFVINDPKQAALASNAKSRYEKLLEDIEAFYGKVQNAISDPKNDQVKLKLAEKKHELALLTKKYIKKLRNKKLKNKLKAEVIVLAFLLKNPKALNAVRIEEIRAEIDKIRWQSLLMHSA